MLLYIGAAIMTVAPSSWGDCELLGRYREEYSTPLLDIMAGTI